MISYFCQGKSERLNNWKLHGFYQVLVNIAAAKVPDHQQPPYLLIKWPQYTGGDFMFLYRFVRRRRHRRRLCHCRHGPQILVHTITFEQRFGFLSFLARLLALIYRLPDYILVDFRHDLDLQFSRSNMELVISQPKMVQLQQNEKQT